MAFLNFYSLERVAAKLQILAMFMKTGSLIIISITGLYFIIAKGGAEMFEDGMEGSHFSPGSLTDALYAGFWAYGGWDTLNSGLEDMRNPKRDLPIASFGGTIIVTLVYLLTNVAYFGVLGSEGMLESDFVVVTFAQKTYGNLVASIVPIIVGIMVACNINVAIFGTSRTMFVAGRGRHFPACFSCLHEKTGSPRPAIFIFVAAITVMFMIGNSLKSFIKYTSFVVWLQNWFAMTALFWIRLRKIPVHPGAIKMPLIIHIIFWFVCLFLVVIPAYKNPVLVAVSLGFVFVGIALFYLFIENRRLPNCFSKLNESFTILVQKIFMVVPHRMTLAELKEEKSNQKKIFPKKVRKLWKSGIAPMSSQNKLAENSYKTKEEVKY